MALRSVLCAAWALACAAALAWAVAIYPLERSWLAAILLTYAALLAWRPRYWLFALPALLPVLDLAPHTGWFFLEEMDLLLLATATSCYWRMARAGRKAAALPHYPASWQALLLVMMLLCATALWRGVQPLPAIDANAFNNYLSPYNALRVAKGWLWALILLPALRHDAGPRLDGLQRYLIPGLLAGLALACYENLRERILFPGLLNFSTDYRSSAPFSAMHTGGAALDGYLALTFPLIAFWLLDRQRRAHMLAGMALLAVAGYVGLATFSRGLLAAYLLAVLLLLRALLGHQPGAPRHRAGVAGAAGRRPWLRWAVLLALAPVLNAVFQVSGYRGYAVALMVLGAAWLRLAAPLPPGRWIGRPRAAPQHGAATLVLMLTLALAIPFGNGYYTGQRLASSGADLQVRLAHWRHVLRMMKDDAISQLAGMGLGGFPAAYYWHNPQGEQPGSYRYVDEHNNRFLRLASANYPVGYGEMLRILQRVELRPDTPYLITFDARNPGADAFLYTSLCERQLLYPENCLAAPRQHLGAMPDWRHFQFAVQSGPLATPTGPWRPPVQLEFGVEGSHAAIDIDNVSLRDALHSHELIRNGAFSEANSYWFFSSDRYHLPWHIKNMALNLYFEMGWAGVLCFAALVGSACLALGRRARDGDPAALPWLASVLAFLVVGLFDSLFDVPRITLLFLLVLGASQLRPGEPP
jgi:hypothetical protein